MPSNLTKHSYDRDHENRHGLLSHGGDRCGDRYRYGHLYGTKMPKKLID